MLSVGGSLLYFNPRPPRGGRLECREHAGRNQCISIHALREEGDGSTTSTSGAFTIFQSTPSARRATSRFCLRLADLFYFNPRPPRGGRHFLGTLVPLAALISIHALREEGDYNSRSQSKPCHYFNPRPPRGGRRRAENRNGHTDRFQSTPSARRATERCMMSKAPAIDFNPRPPRGGRQSYTLPRKG